MMFRKADAYFIVKGSIKSLMYLTESDKWSKDMMKAQYFDNRKQAEDYLQSSKLRAGRIIYLELVGTITDGRYETESFIRELSS